MKAGTFCLIGLVVLGTRSAWALEEESDPDMNPGAKDGITIHRDETSDVTRIRLPLEAGGVSWGDILRAVARARGFDDAALGEATSTRRIPVASRRGRWTLAGLNLLLKPSVQFGVIPGKTKEAEAGLEIVLDRTALLASRRRMKKVLQDALFRVFRRKRRDFGLTLDTGWKDTSIERPLVVVVHGLQSSPERVRAILDDVRQRGHPGATFGYPNDQPLADSAQLLARELKTVSREQPERTVILLTHSMGGLVAREAIENASLDPGNVRRLIMVAPPSQGSVLAHFAFGLEVWECIVTRKDRKLVEQLFATVEDGLGEASRDLQPGSPFLKQLNARPRNPRVRTTIFLGTSAPLDDAALAKLRTALQKGGARSRYVRFFGPKLDGHLADLEEVIRGKGDGAVAVKRGGVAGVTDVVQLPFNHITIWDKPDHAGSRRLREEILKRIEAE